MFHKKKVESVAKRGAGMCQETAKRVTCLNVSREGYERGIKRVLELRA